MSQPNEPVDLTDESNSTRAMDRDQYSKENDIGAEVNKKPSGAVPLSPKALDAKVRSELWSDVACSDAFELYDPTLAVSRGSLAPCVRDPTPQSS